MESLEIAEVHGLQDVRVWRLCESNAVAAYTVDEAIDWYKECTGLTDEELYAYEDIEEVPSETRVMIEEGLEGTESVREIVERNWEDTPFIVINYM